MRHFVRDKILVLSIMPPCIFFCEIGLFKWLGNHPDKSNDDVYHFDLYENNGIHMFSRYMPSLAL